MPETIEDYYERVAAAADDTGRLAMNAEMQAWEVFPFESEGLQLKPLTALADVEAPRNGEDPSQCRCAAQQQDDEWMVWTDDHWQVSLFEKSGAPLLPAQSLPISWPRTAGGLLVGPSDLSSGAVVPSGIARAPLCTASPWASRASLVPV